MKRRAILRDRKRVEAKVQEAINMARRSKVKRRKIYWYRRMENLSKLIASADNLDEALAPPGPGDGDGAGPAEHGSITTSGLLLSRNVSVPFLLRQLGGAKHNPLQKSRRIPHVENVTRELQELSYDILPEDEPRFDDLPAEGPGHRERAAQLYGSFSRKE